LDGLHVLPSPVPQHQIALKSTKFTKRGTGAEEWGIFLFSKEESRHLFSDFGVREGDSGAEPDAVEISYVCVLERGFSFLRECALISFME